MNEKYIWELWSKCKHPHPEYGGGDMIWPMEFAELIVRECISVINTEAAEHEDDDEYERAWKMGTEFAVYQIKQHFGVKE